MSSVNPPLRATVPARPAAAALLVCLLAFSCKADVGAPSKISCATSPVAVVNLAVTKWTELDAACASFPANASTTDSAEYLVIAQSAGGSPGNSAPFILENTSNAAGAPAALRSAPDGQGPGLGQARFDAMLRARVAVGEAGAPSSSMVRAATTPALGAPAPPAVGSLRTFNKVCSDPPCQNYQQVTGKAVVVGQHVAMYLDTVALQGGLNSADLDTLAKQFDGRIYPVDTTAFGREPDIDNNGVVIVLMTPVVNRILPASHCFTTGYVTGFFLAADLDLQVASLYGNGEIIYTMVADTAGLFSCPHTRTTVKRLLFNTFLHELQHMIDYTQHVRVNKSVPEDIWLDEALSKYAEELGARTYLPSDSASFRKYTLEEMNDAYLYLSAPEGHYLIAPTDGDLGSVGAGWLFVRYLVDQYGVGLPGKIVRSKLTGIQNIAVQTGQPFVNVAAAWALANWVSDLPGFAAPPELQYTSWSLRQAFAGLNAQDTTGRYPLVFPLTPTLAASTQVSVTGTLRSGSGQYLRISQPPGAAAFMLAFTGIGSNPLPSSLFPRLEVIRIR